MMKQPLVIRSSMFSRTGIAGVFLAALCLPWPSDRIVAANRQGSYPVARAGSPSADRLASLPAKGLGLLEDLAEDHRSRGRGYARNGRYDLAIQEYSASLRINPDHGATYYYRGFAYAQRGFYERAVEDYNEAIRLHPGGNADSDNQPSGAGFVDPYLALAYFQRALAYHKMARYDWAVEDMTAAIHLRPDFPPAHVNRGVFLVMQGEFRRGVEDYNQALDLQPRFGPAHVNRGQARFFLGRFDEAADDFRHALSVDPGNIMAQAWLYLALRRSGQDGVQPETPRADAGDLKDWPGPILALLLGRMTPEQLMDRVRQLEERERSEKECEAVFYIGQHYLLQGSIPEAEQRFRDVLAFGFSNFIEHVGAQVELQRMHR